MTSLPALPRRRRRRLIDRGLQWLISLGGIGVIGLVALIFVYLVWVAAPLFAAPDAELEARHRPGGEGVLLLGHDERDRIAWRLDRRGTLRVFDPEDGDPAQRLELPGLEGAALRGARLLDADAGLLALHDERDRLHLIGVAAIGSAQDGLARIEQPFGERPLDVSDAAGPLRDLAVLADADALIVATLTADERLLLHHFPDTQPGLELLAAGEPASLRVAPGARRLLLGNDAMLFLATDDGVLQAWDILFPTDPQPLAEQALGAPLTAFAGLALLAGGESVLTARGDRLEQWFVVRGDGDARIVQPRSFTAPAPVRALATEPHRRGFATLHDDRVALFHTSQATPLLTLDAPGGVRADFSAAADRLLVEHDDGTLSHWTLDNPHPEVNLHTLWGRIWYEGYPEPVWVWQSSSAASDFEPKFSLTPLAVGTLKAALYAMLFALPLAILGAIYTGYFMDPALRAWIKPGIEIMAALPTVVLGFLAGLWLAPLVEASLAAFLLLPPLLIATPLLAALLWRQAPLALRNRVPDGRECLLLVPVIVGATAAAFAVAPGLEAALFDGDLRAWLRTELGVDYDQRNALVVGAAMGVAVIPAIFAIAEDAVHQVPRHLVHGSLALGATRWQTLLRVVLLTASPGIFSALMIGFGRAVGETMIVLMATGNTPIIDFSAFTGMRTFAANIAVELPESEVASSHYRILFLAAVVLFAVTFLLNTVAELIRQRLRRQYGAL